MKSKKICLLILILTLMIVAVFPIKSYATEETHGGGGGRHRGGEISTGTSDPYYLNPDNYVPNELKKSDVQGLGVYGGKIAGFIRVIGTIISVGTLMIIGIRFMLGSAEEKAEYKDRMYPYIIGAVLLFAASNLVDVIYGLFKDM